MSHAAGTNDSYKTMLIGVFNNAACASKKWKIYSKSIGVNNPHFCWTNVIAEVFQAAIDELINNLFEETYFAASC